MAQLHAETLLNIVWELEEGGAVNEEGYTKSTTDIIRTYVEQETTDEGGNYLLFMQYPFLTFSRHIITVQIA